MYIFLMQILGENSSLKNGTAATKESIFSLKLETGLL